ncbi:CotH kinase family protein [Butyrivibrio sp. CB08]|uniref:CotH kinase family protein n=1 Tax=Butyrivibrio sp. CB08 TaxID=2364879 RepID=UPI0013147218|nr:CotH kinase family protein [Butyrivibrio sp. CB08]
MSSKRQRIIICLLFVGIMLFFIAYVFSDKHKEPFTEHVVSEDEYLALMEDRIETDEFLYSIFMDGQELIYDSEENFYLYSVSEGGLDSFNPSIQINSYSSSVDIMFCEKEISQDLMLQNESMDFIVYDKTRYQTAHLKFTSLPVMAIDTDEEIPYTRDEIGMHMKLYDNGADAKEKLSVSDGFIHRRGKSSFMNPKGSYKLSLTRSTANSIHSNRMSLLGMPSDDDWILTSMCADDERVRDLFCTNLWAESFALDNRDSINLGTEFKYIEVFLNGRYSGIYALGYKLRNEQIGTSEENKDRVLYFKQDQVPYAPFYVSQSGSVNNFTIESGQKDESFTMFRDFLIKAYECRDNKDELYSLIDLDNIVDIFLYINFIQGVDNTFCNQYLLLDNQDGNYRLLYAPWDMDYSFGRYFSDESDLGEAYVLSPEDMSLINAGIVGNVIRVDQEAFSEKLREKYLGIRATTWSDEHIDELIGMYEDELFSSGAYLRECDRWKIADTQIKEARLSRFRSFVHDRLLAMDKFVENPDYQFLDEEEILTFGSAEAYSAAYGMFERPNNVRLLQINDARMLDYNYYIESMNSLGVPEDMVKTDGSLRDILCSFGDTAFYWEIPEDTDVIVIEGDGGEPMSSASFFSGDDAISLSLGNLTYHPDENGNGTFLLDDEVIYTDNNSSQDYSLRVFLFDPDSLAVKSIEEW